VPADFKTRSHADSGPEQFESRRGLALGYRA
jgi:hypothetical protein